MPKNPYNNLLFDHIDGLEYFLIFWVRILSYGPLLKEGTTADFPALGSSHNHPCAAPLCHDTEIIYSPKIFLQVECYNWSCRLEIFYMGKLCLD